MKWSRPSSWLTPQFASSWDFRGGSRPRQPVKTQVVEPRRPSERPTSSNCATSSGTSFPTFTPSGASRRAPTSSTCSRARHREARVARCDRSRRANQRRGDSVAVDKLLREYMRQQILDRGLRLDGRGPETSADLVSRRRASTHPRLVAVHARRDAEPGNRDLGATRTDEQIIDQMMLDGRKRFMLHYNFPPYRSARLGASVAESSLDRTRVPGGEFSPGRHSQ